MRIIIIGAGLGGLAASFCFARQGHTVILLERRHSLSKKGGGVSIRSGATQVLISWGLREEFEAVSDDYATTVFRDLYTGEIINSSIAVEVSEWPDWGTEREAIQRILWRNAVRAGVEVRMGCVVEDVSEDDNGASVVLGDGAVVSADLVLVADGIGSRLRSKVLCDCPGPIHPIVSDITVYGIKLSLEQARRDLDLARFCAETDLNVSFGKDSFVVFRSSEKLEHCGGVFAIKEVTDQKSLWDEEGDIEYVRNAFSNADPALVAALRLAKSCDRWKLAEMPDLPRWSSKSGQTLLLGDSAHAMQPQAAQGFSQIIEDIGALEYLLTLQKPMSFVASTWESIRKPRVERIKAYALANTDLFLGKTPRPPKMAPSSRVKDKRKIKSLKSVSPDSSAPFNSAPFYKWAYDHDVVKEVQKYLSEGERARL